MQSEEGLNTFNSFDFRRDIKEIEEKAQEDDSKPIQESFASPVLSLSPVQQGQPLPKEFRKQRRTGALPRLTHLLLDRSQ